MESLIRILYVVSTALLVPVILTLLFMLGWSLMEAGGFVREYLDRRKGRKEWRRLYKNLSAKSSGSSRKNPAGFNLEFFGKPALPGFLGKFSYMAQQLHGDLILMHKLMADLEIEIAGKLSRMSFGTRLGPMLGLMGTLIPLGPALIGLTSGNIHEMAMNLVVAFSTTVLGLAVGGLCYGMNLARRRWYAQDMADIEFVMNWSTRNKGGEIQDDGNAGRIQAGKAVQENIVSG